MTKGHYCTFQNPMSGWDTFARYQFGRLYVQPADNHAGVSPLDDPEAYRLAKEWCDKLDKHRFPSIWAAVDALEAAGVEKDDARELLYKD